MNFIEKHSKILAVALCACTTAPVLSTVYAYETQPGWHGEGKNRSYVLESTRQEATGLTEIDDELYYFDQDGVLQFGWQNVGNDLYYFTSEGTAATGEVVLQGTTYNFQEEGKLLQGWQEDGTYYNNNGSMVTESWMDIDGVTYYFNVDGQYVTGWQDLEGKKFYFNTDGSLAKGEVSVDGTTYYLSDSGELKTGWVQEGENSYYFKENGQKAVNESMDIEGKKYFFDENGNLLKDTTKDGYTIDSEGVATEVKEEVQTPVSNNQSSSQPSQSTGSTNTSNSNTSSSNSGSQSSSNTGNSSSSNQGTANVPTNVSGSAIASAALAQIGVTQDCTSLVSNSLAAVGINFHGWPSQYAQLGSWTSSPQVGDIIIYSGHVAIYIGNGQAVHGGWNGNQTVIASVNCSNALVGYIRVGA